MSSIGSTRLFETHGGTTAFATKHIAVFFERGAIEAALSVCEGVTQAVVVSAHVLPLDGFLDIEDIRKTLKWVLPEHMVSSGFVGLSRLPLTASGKVDRKGPAAAELPLALKQQACLADIGRRVPLPKVAPAD